MKTKVYAIVVSVLLVVSIGFITVLVLQSTSLNSQVAGLNNQLSLVQSRVQMFETREEVARQNDVSIYLEDPHNFVANGVVSLGNQAVAVETYRVIQQDGSEMTRYLYRLDSVPGLLTNSDEWVRIEAVKGETIHLVTSSYNDGPDYIAYYTCYTNSSHCTARTVETGILAQQ